MRSQQNLKLSLSTEDLSKVISNEPVQNGKYISMININRIPNDRTSHNDLEAEYLHQKSSKIPIKLSNFTTLHQNSDYLYSNSKIGCQKDVCLGSLMFPSNNSSSIRNNEEILEQASDFYQQYLDNSKGIDQSSLVQRLEEIGNEIRRTGTYSMTSDELIFGAKTAWRNASRCIGRIQWNNLEIQDARHVRTTAQMFDSLCKQIELATNGGNLKSYITVFPQRNLGRSDFRIWNSQLLGYAGYLQLDGSIIGDPARAQFTRICQRLGWKGKNGAFDILPLVLSAPDETVKFYEIPDEIILKVKIDHPVYDCFAQMKLEWYALPAVSDMQFDCGGIQYTACAFNGWYMGTEIGARNFCDPQRYNLIETIATKLCLDISNQTTLWKDKSLVEMNVAVLYSFQKAGVTIIDHHSASESFIKHMRTEFKQRNGCPADWIWIVPPISGSLTPVFHQEMLNYKLKPSFEYQDKAWRHHKWTQSSIKLKHSLKSVSQAALWTVCLMASVRSKRIKLTILYATETGKSETFAHKLTELMNISFSVQLLCLEDYSIDNLFSDSFVVIVTSTFGNGEAPDNGKEFWKSLSKLSLNKQTDTFSHLKYAVFALGSTQYITFCTFGKNIDKTLQRTGAKPILPIGLGDELRGQEQTFNSWAQECYTRSCVEFNVQIVRNDITTANFNDSTYDSKSYRVIETNSETNELQIKQELTRIHNKNIVMCKMIDRIRLQPKQSDRQTILVRLCTSDEVSKNQLVYYPGDHMAIWPSNPKELVNALLAHVCRNGYAESGMVYQVQELVQGEWIANTRLPACSLRVAFTQYLDITTPPTQQCLSYLKDMAIDKWDAFRLKKLANDCDNYEEWRSYNMSSLVDVLSEFPSIQMEPAFLLTQWPLLQPRYYSISSSQKFTPYEVHLTMDVVSYRIHGGKGIKRKGICSNFIDSCPKGDIPCYLRITRSFRLAENKTLPIIMIGAGSGIAPFRSFWLDREVDIKAGVVCGKMYLFYGCRDSQIDNIYAHDLEALVTTGVLDQIFLAYSCQNLYKKNYVQDEIFRQRSMLYKIITKEKAHIYICGHSLMADGVKKSFIRLFESEGNMSEDKALEIMNQLYTEERYHEDVFGIYA